MSLSKIAPRETSPISLDGLEPAGSVQGWGSFPSSTKACSASCRLPCPTTWSCTNERKKVYPKMYHKPILSLSYNNKVFGFLEDNLIEQEREKKRKMGHILVPWISTLLIGTAIVSTYINYVVPEPYLVRPPLYHFPNIGLPKKE